MGKLSKLTSGILLGAAISVAVARWLATDDTLKVRERLTERLAALQEEARRAAEAQRRALENEIARLREGMPEV